jgi:prevent-host-death family protein
MKTMSLTETRNRLLEIAERIERDPDEVIGVTKRGRRVMTVLSAERYDAVLETLEVLADAEAMRSLERARKEIALGKGIPWRKARERLRLGA